MLTAQHDWRMAEWIICWVGCGLFLLLALLYAPSHFCPRQILLCSPLACTPQPDILESSNVSSLCLKLDTAFQLHLSVLLSCCTAQALPDMIFACRRSFARMIAGLCACCGGSNKRYP